MLSLRITLSAVLLLAATVPPARAQGKDITLAVLPFGSIARSHRGGSEQVAQEVVSLAQEAEVYTVLDRSSDENIERELRQAESFRNFDSKVKLETTARLNASALLIGVIEDETIERHTERGEKPRYSARIGLRVKIVHTQTGQLIKSKYFELKNESSVTRELDKRGVCKLPKIVCDRLKAELEDRVQGSKVAAVEELGSTEDEARRNALKGLREPMIAFLQESYGSVLAASRRK